MKPLVSVCIPVYNSHRWIKQTVESVLNQTYDNIEILIVDDGSTDGSWQIIQKLKEKSPRRIKIFRQENKGACAARNKAFNESRGDFIQWLDADDLLETDKIEKQLKAINFVKRTDILLPGSFAKFNSILKQVEQLEIF